MILGVDPGTRRTGIAVADLETKFARPLEVVDSQRVDPVERIAELVTELNVSLVVVGRPTSLSGAPGPAVRAQEELVGRLRAALAVEVDEFDERLTTVIAERALLAGGSKRRTRDALKDAVAAQVMLQDYLEANAGRARPDRRQMKLTRRGRVVVALGVLLALVCIPLLGGYLYLNSIGVFGSSEPGPPVEVEIPEGAEISEMGDILAEAGVIKSGMGLRIRAYLDGGSDGIQAGTYRLPTNLNAGDALAALLEGPEMDFVNVTFPEGSWVPDFARIAARDTHLSRAEVLKATTDGSIRASIQPEGIDTLEGLMFPSTYQVVESDTAKSLVGRLVDEFESRVGELDRSKLDGLGVSPYEAVIVASMVEAEARVPEDRGPIARVIYNRIAAGDRIGIDATVLYALGEHRAELTSSDLAIDSPYNTRLYTGLPPTPIGAPGAESLEAAFDPPEGDWYYFVVADCEGHHAFSVSDDEFLADKARYQALDC